MAMTARLPPWLVLVALVSGAFPASATDWQDRGVTAVSRPAPLSFQLNHVYRHGAAGPFQPLSNGAVLRSGDQYKIIFTPTEDAYVYIFQADSAGQVFRLFPMEEFGGIRLDNLNPVTGGKTYFLPTRTKAFQLDRQTGTERIYFTASRQPTRDLEGLYEELSLARRQRDREQTASAQSKLKRLFKRRGVRVVGKDEAPSVSWQQGGEVFSAIGRRLEGLCGECVNVIEFAHE